jgi:signal transduction histidine kinase
MPTRGFRGPPWRRTGSPPPWWPEGEPWPPEEPAGGGARPAFHKRVLIAAVVLIALLAISIAITIHGRPGGWGPPPGEGPPFPWFVPFFWLGFIAVAVWTVRRLRRSIEPISDIMEAAHLVANGDYSRRVTPRGPRDVRQLVEAFNTMTLRLAANEEQRKHLFADTAHELRTPLAVIRGTIEGMIDGVYPRDDAHLVPLLDQTTIIARLLDDLQTIATAEAGVLVLHRTETDLAALIRDAVASFAPGAERNGVDLHADVQALPEVSLDPVRIRQVLDNLVANALRYTPAGGSVRIEAASNDGMVRVSVRDTGRGMTPEDISRVFERFVKSADSGGSGLGLAIARSLVEAHGGTIAAESAPGKGTTITFTLPVNAPA